MPTQLDLRQSVLRAALGMVGSSAGDTADTLFPKINNELAKLFEDRNVMLQNGGIITFTGTQIQFTEDLEIAINQKISGAAPQVISLGMANIDLDNEEMWYAILDRSAGTATTNIATSLPAAVAANQEIFLIAKRVDAGDGTQRVYWRNGMALNAGQSVRLGASGSGGGSGTGDDLNALLFRASFHDPFDEGPTDSKSAVDVTSGKTDPATYNAAKAMYVLNYDASKTIAAATTTTTINLSANASFTVKIGDMVISGAQARRITAVANQASFTVEAFDVAPALASQVTVSQAVHTKDIYNLAVDGNALSAAFSGETFGEILTDYEDTTTAGDNIFDVNVAPVVAFDASHNGTSWTDVKTRPTLETTQVQSVILNDSGTALYQRFYAFKTSGSGTVNVLRYKSHMQKLVSASAGGVTNSAYAFTDGTGTEVNCTVGLMGGKTTITLDWQYAVGVLLGTTASSIEVWLNGQKLPRFLDPTTTPDGSFIELSSNMVQLDKDYSALNVSVEIFQRTQIVDNSTVNTTNIASQQEIFGTGFQPFVASNILLNPTNVAGTPAAGTFYSAITNRKPITDLTQDLRPRLGVTRIPFSNIVPLQDEFGPNGETVSALAGDRFGQVRFVGFWQNFVDSNGSRPGSNPISTSNDFVEITFYGTGLNVLNFFDTNARTISWSVDGGSLTALSPAAASNVLANRNWNANSIVAVVNNLPLGIHTVRLQATGTVNITIYGVEILNEASTLVIPPGISYLAGKKYVSASQQTSPFASSFESGTLGTRGGRVVVYQKADGSIGKAITPTNATQQNLSAADHTNEEVIRSYNWREFGAGRGDDYSTLSSSSSTRNFTLEDGSTILWGTGQIVGGSTIGQGLTGLAAGNFVEFTFTGTGLDIQDIRGATIDTTYTITIDTVAIATAVSGATLFGTIGYAKSSKIVSGLPYGTHTVRFTTVVANTTSLNFSKFIVYGPKKPSVPAGAVELADYNVVANFSALNVNGPDAISGGVIRKHNIREMKYVGTWSYNQSTGNVGGTVVQSSTNADYVEYVFWGTGFDMRFASITTSFTIQMTLDGSTNVSGFTNSSFGTGITSWTPATGTIVSSTTAVSANRVSVTGLTLGLHTIRITKTAGAGLWTHEAFDIITPIHVSEADSSFEIQNTNPIGNMSLSDNRKLSPVTDNMSKAKAMAKAVGIASGPTTTTTVPVPMPDMSLTITLERDALVEIIYVAEVTNNTGSTSVTGAIYVDGAQVGFNKVFGFPVANIQSTMVDSNIVPLSAGTHKIDVYWNTGAGTMTAQSTRRNVTAREL